MKRAIVATGSLIAAVGLVGRLVLVFQGEPFMEGRLYALFVAGLVLALVGLGYNLLFEPGAPDVGEAAGNADRDVQAK